MAVQSWLPKGFEFLSGLPERFRRRRLLMTLQAWFDESGTRGTDRFMVLAGLLGEAEVFANVADEWDKHLRATYPGAIRYFKLDEACGLTGEFRHWQEGNRDIKIRQMASVIDRDDIMEIAVVMDLQAFDRVSENWKHIKGHHAMRVPYVALYSFVLNVVVIEAIKRGHDKPIELVFDNQDAYKKTILECYDDILIAESQNPLFRSVLPVMPGFRDDKEFVLLQAADLLAGELRLMSPDDDAESMFGSLCPKLKSGGYFHMITETQMRYLDQYVRDFIANERRDGSA